MCEIADFSGPQDARVEQRQEEKLDKYPDLATRKGKLGILPLVITCYESRHIGEQIAHWDMQCSTN